MLRTHTCGELSIGNAGQNVMLSGWVDTFRDHGGVLFIDLRDRWGLTQIIFNPKENKALHEEASRLRSEYVVQIKGRVIERPKGTINDKLKTGQIEVHATELSVLNTSPTPPIEVTGTTAASEEIRLKYRFLDLRRPLMQQKLLFRYRLTKVARDYLDSLGFVEVETPYFTKSTPEGARDYLVPCRLMPGTFYALPQSPQLFKQILMVAGYDRYFQFARCFRDEDLRADRQPEHTQIDMEMSFVDREDILSMVEGMVQLVFKKMLGKDITLPLRRISYDEAMNDYGSDKPDLRFGMPLVALEKLFANTGFQVFQKVLQAEGAIKGLCVKGGAQFSRKDIDELTEYVSRFGAKGLAWIKVAPDGSLESQVVKFFKPEELQELKSVMTADSGDLILMVADCWKTTCDALGALRLYLGKKLNLIAADTYELCWVLDFPLLEWNEEEKRYQALHHPFTAPKAEHEALLDSDPLRIKARAYDLVLNGTEIGGGSIRIHSEALQEKVFSILGIGKEEAEVKFGFLLNALKYGAPPHGGIALGLDRLTAMLLGTDSIRDVIAFPKTQKGICPLTEAPAPVDERQLEELSIRLKLKK